MYAALAVRKKRAFKVDAKHLRRIVRCRRAHNTPDALKGTQRVLYGRGHSCRKEA